MTWYHIDATKHAITVSVHVQPNAKTTSIQGLHGEALKIRLSTPPVDGKANKALLSFLAECFDVPVRQVSLVSGQQSRQKRIRIIEVDQLPDCFNEWI